MTITRGLKIRIYPNKEQILQIEATFGCCRYVYNHMLSRNDKVYKRRGEHLSYIDMQNLLPQMKEYLPWLKEPDSTAIRYACRNLDTAYQKFFKEHDGYPKYKSKKGKQSYTTEQPTTIKLTDKKICLPKLGWINAHGIRPLPEGSKICNVTVSRDPDGKYYGSVTYKYDTDINYTIPTSPITIGLDYKISGLYVDSNGDSGGKPKHYADSLKLLQRRQKQLSHMIESHIAGYKTVGNKRYPIYDRQLSDCKNIQKKRRQIARLQKHISNQRKDFLHQKSTAIAKQYDIVCIEDLEVRGMLVDKTDMDSHAARSNINHTIMDDGWCRFTQMLDYKLSERGKQLIKVSKDYPSSQTCSRCGHQQDMPPSIRKYRCPICGLLIDRDHNAALNIKNEGMQLLKPAWQQ